MEIKHLSESDKYSHHVKLLRSIPGIVLITSMVILTEIEDVNRFANAERFASFIGLIPMTNPTEKSRK